MCRNKQTAKGGQHVHKVLLYVNLKLSFLNTLDWGGYHRGIPYCTTYCSPTFMSMFCQMNAYMTWYIGHQGQAVCCFSCPHEQFGESATNNYFHYQLAPSVHNLEPGLTKYWTPSPRPASQISLERDNMIREKTLFYLCSWTGMIWLFSHYKMAKKTTYHKFPEPMVMSYNVLSYHQSKAKKKSADHLRRVKKCRKTSHLRSWS